MALDVTPLLSRPTGVGVMTRELVSRLADSPGLALSGFALSWRGRGRLAAVLPAGVAPLRRPMAARPLRALWRRADRPPIEWWTGPVEVVHGPNFVTPPAARAAEVVTVHDLTPLRYPELCTADTLAYPELVRRALRRGAWVHAVSPFVAAEVVAELGASPDRVVCVPNGVTRPAAEGDPALGRALAGGDRFVLALGTVEPRKDLPTLVAAFDALAAEDGELRLVLAGPDGWGAAALDAAVQAARHRRRIVRLGWVEEHQRAALLAAARVYAYPSLYEGFGLPTLEAMAAGAVVVTTTAGALPDTVGDAALLAPPGAPDALAETLRRALEDDALRAELVARGAAQVERFSWARAAVALEQLYRRAWQERESRQAGRRALR
ncbi:MAG: glycosyltransferase family 4 protein [Acidimicrobiales bacterium]